MIVELDLTKKKNKLKEEATRQRDTELEAGFIFSVDGLAYPCDPVLQEVVKTYLLAYAVGKIAKQSPVRIRRMDNSFWYPSFTELLPFAGELMAHGEQIWTDYWSKKDKL